MPRKRPIVPPGAIALVTTERGISYRGKLDCANVACERDADPSRCAGWHCATCHGISNIHAFCPKCDKPKAKS